MKIIPSTFLALTLLFCACGTDSPDTEARSTTSESRAATSSVVDPAANLARTWLATAVTINGKTAPEMDPNGKVVFTLNADSTFVMHDATEGDLEVMTGSWRFAGNDLLTLIDNEFNEVTDFRVTELNAERMVTQVLEETEVEVLLHYRAR